MYLAVASAMTLARGSTVLVGLLQPTPTRGKEPPLLSSSPALYPILVSYQGSGAPMSSGRHGRADKGEFVDV